MITGTVALPIYNSLDIFWLCLESLCRQHRPKEGWELIVYEEKQPRQVGDNLIRLYLPRLKEKGCERFTYITFPSKIPLPQKWLHMAKKADPNSKYYCLTAADNYYHPWMLVDSEKAIQECDWFVTTKGYFYDFNYKKILLYDCNINIGLQMTASTKLVRNLPMVNLSRGIDGWFYKNLHAKKVIRDKSDHWRNTFCTNGYNNISKSRGNFFKRPHSHFYATDVNIHDILPEDIVNRIILLNKNK